MSLPFLIHTSHLEYFFNEYIIIYAGNVNASIFNETFKFLTVLKAAASPLNPASVFFFKSTADIALNGNTLFTVELIAHLLATF